MGNPHLVLFVEDDPERFHVGHIGPALEHHELFPERTNVEFAQVRDDGIEARVWERGSGETMACGTGACAVAVAANEAGLVRAHDRRAVPGRAARGRAPESGEVLLTGEAEHVFDGVVDLDHCGAASAREGAADGSRRARAPGGADPRIGEPRRP